MTTYIGVDISKRSYAVAVETTKGLYKREFANQPTGHKQMGMWVKGLIGKDEPCFVMEATSTYYLQLAIFLGSRGKKVAVVNARYVHNFAFAMGYKNKTDLTDAQVLARFGKVT